MAYLKKANAPAGRAGRKDRSCGDCAGTGRERARRTWLCSRKPRRMAWRRLLFAAAFRKRWRNASWRKASTLWPGCMPINIGDLRKAREYYQQALASLEASAAVRKKALEADRYSPEQKAAMSKEELAKHEETQAQMRDMKIALDAMSQAMALISLGEISQEQGDFKVALADYQKALKVGEDLPKGGYLNVFEMFRARIRARVLGDLASLHAESGEVDLALKELNETIALKRSIGQDDWTAQSLIQAADLESSKGGDREGAAAGRTSAADFCGRAQAEQRRPGDGVPGRHCARRGEIRRSGEARRRRRFCWRERRATSGRFPVRRAPSPRFGSSRTSSTKPRSSSKKRRRLMRGPVRWATGYRPSE